MSEFAIISEAVARLSDAGTGPVLVAKWTLLLALAWLANAALAGRNPRWRVALWRGAIVGIVAVAALAVVPPIVRYPLAPRVNPVPEVRHEPRELRHESVPPAVVVPAPAEPGPASHDASPSIPRPVPELAAVPRPVGATTMPTAAPAAVAEPWHSPVPRATGSWVVWVWLAGVVILTARLILAALALDRLVRRSADAPDDIARECRAIAEHLGCTRIVRVVRSADVATPCLAGVLRPVLLLPGHDRQGPDDLPAILAHELAHARHHDLAWNLGAHLASIVLWFHPLAWRIRAAHAAACDAVSDAVAADYLGDVASYGRTLARLAVEASSPAPAHVLAMARTSEVWRRLDALNRRVFRNPLSRKYALPASAAGAMLLVLIGGFGITRAQVLKASPAAGADDPPRAAAPIEAGRLVLRAVEAATGEPIDGVSIEYQGRFNGNWRRGTVTAGEDGTAAIEWAAGERVDELRIIARKPKLVPIRIAWDGKRHPIPSAATRELRFEPGTTISGTVKDESGHPIAGATVDAFGQPSEPDGAIGNVPLGTVQTDAQGRWRLDGTPRDLSKVWVAAKHPRYREPAYDTVASIGRDSTIVLKKGLTVTGRVVNAAGRPIRGARAVAGRDAWGNQSSKGATDERGAFTVENCDAGLTILTVQANGFAPQIQDVIVGERTPPVVVRMTEPGATVRGRVVNIAGQPVAGAFVAADTWRGNRSIAFRVDTDKDGRFEWRSAPRDVVRYDIGREGYMASRQVALIASDREQSVILYPILTISGRVTDAVTGRPIETFRVVQGRPIVGGDRIHWSEDRGVDESGGKFRSEFDEPSPALYVRVEAPGYRTAESRAFRPDEGRQTFDFALRPTAALSGVVQLPDGKPAAGVEVALVTQGHTISLQSGRFERDANVPRSTTATDGRFAFGRPAGAFLLIAAGDAGFAEAASDEWAKTNKLTLQPWGRIEGGVRIGARAGADQEVTFQPTRPPRPGGFFVFSYGYIARTEERGRFAFDRVIPGPGTVSRVIVADMAGGGRMHMPCWPESIEVKPRETLEVKIGGRGRPVIGRIALDGTPEMPVELDAERSGGDGGLPRQSAGTLSPLVSATFRSCARPGPPRQAG